MLAPQFWQLHAVQHERCPGSFACLDCRCDPTVARGDFLLELSNRLIRLRGMRISRSFTRSLTTVAGLCGCFLVVGPVAGAPQSWSVTSPNGQVCVTVELNGAPRSRTALTYRVDHNGVVVLKRSPLGLRLESVDLVRKLRFVSAQPERVIAEKYVLLHGKRRECANEAREVSLKFAGSGKRELEIVLRAFNDGIAFRYRVEGGRDTDKLIEEHTGFALPEDARFWCAPADKPTTYAPAYETYYALEQPVSSVAPLGLGWSFPMLYRTGATDRWALITEAGLGTNFCGSRLSSAATNGVFVTALADAGEGNGTGSVHPSSTLPWEMPWRVVIMGDSLASVVESTLVTDVSPPQEVKETAWIKPGRVAWSWWSDNPSPKDAEKQKRFVDLAAEMGWEYVLVDANWTIMEKGNVHEVLDYAKSKNVGVLLWYNSGGPHNIVTEKPRDTLTYAPVRKFELDMLKGWGVKGVKVDFFQSDKQNVIELYQAVMRDAAERQIMVNFHGCTLPRGWERTWPHLMSMEAVRGAECYLFDSKYPDSAPVQNTILPFTRNAVGPMDYTPVTFSDNRYPHKTSAAHELALAVLFQSGWLHFGDRAEAYLGLPAEPKKFLKNVPVVWDETRFVAGHPGKFAVLARRAGSTWYVAGVNGEGSHRSFELSAKWSALMKGAQWIGDGASAGTFETGTLTSPIRMAPFGGFVAVSREGGKADSGAE